MPPNALKVVARRSTFSLKGMPEYDGQCKKWSLSLGFHEKRSSRSKLMGKAVAWLERACICRKNRIMPLLSMRM
jgi:hypothetical protein